MPIRSDRGRNATLRSLATWPLYTPRRLAASLGVLAVLSIGATLTVTATSRTHSSTLSPSSTPPALPTTSWSALPGTTAVAVRPVMLGDPLGVSRRFADIWVSKQDPPTWRTSLTPLCTEEFSTVVLPTMTPEHVSATTVTGTATVVRATSRTSEITLPLDTMVIAFTLQDVAGRGDWRVADIRLVR
jgi:hypothetical protein